LRLKKIPNLGINRGSPDRDLGQEKRHPEKKTPLEGDENCELLLTTASQLFPNTIQHPIHKMH
jgi:hypothetical protein